MGDDRAVNETQRVGARLRECDWIRLRAIVDSHSPTLMEVLGRHPDSWSKKDVSDLGFAIGAEIMTVGIEDAGVVNERGEDLEALFSRLPQFD